MSTVESDISPVVEDAGGTGAALAGRAPRISQADVFQAADALLVEGHRPTVLDKVAMRSFDVTADRNAAKAQFSLVSGCFRA